MNNNWQIKKLGEIGKVFNGNSINERVKKEKYLNLDNGFPFIATKDIDFETHLIDYNNGVRIPFVEKKFKIAHKNSVLICAEGGSAGKKIAFNINDICFGNKLFAIETKTEVSPKLVYYWYLTPMFFDSFKLQINGIIGGVSIGNFKNLEIPLPPLPEQYRIVKILDETFEKIEKAKENAEKNLKNSKELFECYLQSVFVNPGNDWEEKRLGDVCDTGAGGTPLKSHKDYYENGHIPWVRSGEVCKKEIIKSELFITEKGLKNSSARLFPPDTVLIAMYGATAAQAGILKFEASTNQAVCGILPNNNFLPEFIYYFFLAKKGDLVKQAVGGAQPNISQIKIKNTFIPVLPISRQKLIVDQLNMISAETKKLETIYKEKLANLEELKKSILKKAFNGEL